MSFSLPSSSSSLLHQFFVSNSNRTITHSTRGVISISKWRRIRYSKSKQYSFFLPTCSADDNNVPKTSGARGSSLDQRGSIEDDGKDHEEPLTSTKILKKLQRYGISGILAYGLLNTAYYITAFLSVWFYVSPAPGKMGFRPAAERFLKMMAMVWAGSQVTKLMRAGGALALAPFVDRGLSWFTIKFNFESQGKAFLAIVGFCLVLAVILFLTVTLLST